MELPSTVSRVTDHTPDWVNMAIQQNTDEAITYYRRHPEKIIQRLNELDQEWDIERTLEANAASLILIGTALGFTVSRKLFFIPLGVSAFLLQHALQGWCPPVSIFRRLGVHTSSEIHRERTALEELARGQWG